MFSQLYALNTKDVALPARAAAGESDRARWEDCFAQLLSSGLLSFPVRPGSEIGLSIGSHERGASPSSIASLCHQILVPVLRADCQICLDVSGLQQADVPVWERQLQLLTAASVDNGSLGVSLGIGDSLFAQDLARIRTWVRRGGRVAVRYPVPESSADLRSWQELIRSSHADIGIQPVPVSAVRLLSPLHTCEKGQTVMPTGLFDAPSLTAWLVIDLDARRLGDPLKLRRQLAHCLRFADNLIDAIDWPLSALRLDALLNRRVALRLTHVGDMLADVGLLPDVPGTFCSLQRWLVFLRDSFVHESMLLARLRGPFPELCAGELVNNLRARYGVADANRLVKNRMLRHRHLLALSPLVIFPDASWPGRAADWISLIPAIACADAITMAGPDIRARLSISDWERLLRLTAALAGAAVKVKRARFRATT